MSAKIIAHPKLAQQMWDKARARVEPPPAHDTSRAEERRAALRHNALRHCACPMFPDPRRTYYCMVHGAYGATFVHPRASVNPRGPARLAPDEQPRLVKRTATGLADFDKARPLMDSSQIAIAKEICDGLDVARRFYLQALWDVYCDLHRRESGQPFAPDVDPSWG